MAAMTSPETSPVTPAALLALACGAAREAGELVRQRPADLGVDTKSTPTDVVTTVDGAAERLIVGALLAARPQDGVFGEEGAGIAGSSGVRWVIDPIDGTVNYVYNLPAYAVSIAAELDGKVVAGAVLDVAAGALFTATLGGGAGREEVPLHCNAQEDLSQSLIGTGFSYDAAVRRRQAEILTAVLPKVRDIRRFGSCALDLCAVAGGRLDGYYEYGPSLWDYAAGGLIAREAGATVRGVHGGLVVASAPGIFGALTALLPD
jgi:Archaeal fructose-1,6-bisphosphatase and related enzymes of inositol monophosphatase family